MTAKQIITAINNKLQQNDNDKEFTFDFSPAHGWQFILFRARTDKESAHYQNIFKSRSKVTALKYLKAFKEGYCFNP